LLSQFTPKAAKKKRKRKKKAKTVKKTGNALTPMDGEESMSKAAMLYLEAWQNKTTSGWKFRKVRQVAISP
jgi:hypothetical protein